MRARSSAVFFAVLLSGCATAPSAPTWTLTGDPLVDGQTAIASCPPRDKVLWQERTALVAMRRGEYALAKQLLDDAIRRIGGIYGPDADAKRARSHFTAESKKTFIGEPYERVMAYYYRGILYWMDGEIDNARACFRSAQFTDADAENGKYNSDYVLLDYLEGLATTSLGGDGSPSFKRAEALAKQPLPPYNLNANVLIFADFGIGPAKYASGQYGEQLRFRPGSSEVQSIQITVGNQTARAPALDDLTFQATTRGGRVMDYVLANKAVFKSTTSAMGTAAIIGGAVVASQGNGNNAATGVGAGLMMAGLITSMVSAATTPEADTRAWQNLPQHLAFVALQLPPGPHEARIDFLDRGGNPVGGLAKTLTIEVLDPPRSTVVFVSSKNQ